MKRNWTQEEIDTLSQLYPNHYASEIAEILGRGISSIHCKAQSLGLESSREKIQRTGYEASKSPASIAARFKKGSMPLNKGKKVSPEVYSKMQPTMFKKGQTPLNHRDVGSERVNVYGYIEIKVAEPNRWRLKHRVIWEQVNGAIPKGFNVQFKNHNRQDCRIENLYLISKAEQLAKENSFWAKYPKEIQEIIHLKGVVNRAIHKVEKNGK